MVIINGKGASGKDTLINFFEKENPGKVFNVSSIDPIKEIATMYGYTEDSKTEKARKFLSDLKKVFTDWNELPTKYCLDQLEKFCGTELSEVMFVHIREPEEIEKFKRAALSSSKRSNIVVKTLLVTSKRCEDKSYGKSSDDNVDSYTYDFYYHNDKYLNAAKYDFLLFMEENIIPTKF